MPSKRILILVLLPLLVLPSLFNTSDASPAAPTPQWSKTFGYFAAYTVAPTNDGGLLVAAQSASGFQYHGHLAFNYKDINGVLIKVDSSGEMLWNKSLPILPEAMLPTADDGFIIAGEEQVPFGISEIDTAQWPIHQNFVSLTKIDQDGNMIWNRKYNLPHQPLPNPTANIIVGTDTGATVGFLLQTSDEGYLIGGSYTMNSSAFERWSIKPWLIRTDALGNSVWMQAYGADSPRNASDTNAGSISSAAQTDDGGYLFVGNVGGLALTKTDYQGNIQWSKIEVPNSTAQNSTTYQSVFRTVEGYLLVGNKNYYINNMGTSYAYLSRLDSSFNEVSSSSIEGQELYRFTLRYNTSDAYFFTASDHLIKTDLEGNPQWIGNYNGIINALTPITDGYAVAGLAATEDFVETTNIWVAKLAYSSNAGPSPSVPEFANPALLTALTVLSIGIIIAVFVYVKRTKKTKPMPRQN